MLYVTEQEKCCMIFKWWREAHEELETSSYTSMGETQKLFIRDRIIWMTDMYNNCIKTETEKKGFNC